MAKKIKFELVNDDFEKGLIKLIHANNGATQVVGKNTAISSNTKKQTLISTEWFNNFDPAELKNNNHDINILSVVTIMKESYDAINYLHINDDGIAISDVPLSPYNLMKHVIDDKPIIAFVNTDKYDEYLTYLDAAKNIAVLYKRFSIYKHIIAYNDGKPELNNILDILFTLNEKDRIDSITAFKYSNGFANTLQALADRILEKAEIQEGQELMTQEQQVESFIDFSKLVANEKTEIVTDEMLNNMKASANYQRIVSELAEHGFGLSETQQFNVLQSAAYLSLLESNKTVMYNLSDMGAGKTLMTVESTYLMDLQTAKQFLERENIQETIDKMNAIYLPSKNLIAPKLSVKSSWVETFELFYNVEVINDNQYKMSFEYDGTMFYTYLNVSAFTVRSNALTVDASLPEPIAQHEILIIDEIHQLVKRKVTRSRFFAPNITPSDSYQSFVLSGTLSNLTTLEWYNYVAFMGVAYNDYALDNKTPKELESEVSSIKRMLKTQIKASAENLSVEQKRYFDPSTFDLPQMTVQKGKHASFKNDVFNLKYASKILTLHNENQELQDAFINDHYKIDFDDNVISTPNFELFYQLVGSCAITAQSTQIAEELFGKQKTQHNAEVINTPSALSANDVQLLRVLHDITTDYNIYKSQAIATAINNAILNLNDGLANKNIYQIISKYAESNMRFFQYLSTLDLNILETLPASGLINEPELEETPKFKVLQDILASEPDETHLIVVNDYIAMTKLAKALGIESLKRSDLKNPLDYQDVLDAMFEKQSVVIVPQMMIKSSLDLVQANRLIQYQLNTEISDIIQTQNRINRIGQTRETKAYYIATDVLQKNIIELFLETYKNIRVAHKGIVELFVDMSSQVNVVNDYISKAMNNIVIDEPTNETTKLIEHEDGTMSLFDTSEYETGEPETSEEVKPDNIIEFPHFNPNQTSLFSPLEEAASHQLSPYS